MAYMKAKHLMPKDFRVVIEERLIQVRNDIKEGKPSTHTIDNIKFLESILKLPYCLAYPEPRYAESQLREKMGNFKEDIYVEMSRILFYMYCMCLVYKANEGQPNERIIIVFHGPPGEGKSYAAEKLPELLGIIPLRARLTNDPKDFYGTKEQPGAYAEACIELRNKGERHIMVGVFHDGDRVINREAILPPHILQLLDPTVLTIPDNYYGVNLLLMPIAIFCTNHKFGDEAASNRIGKEVLFLDPFTLAGKRDITRRYIRDVLMFFNALPFALTNEDITDADIDIIMERVTKLHGGSIRNLKNIVRDYLVEERMQAKYRAKLKEDALEAKAAAIAKETEERSSKYGKGEEQNPEHNHSGQSNSGKNGQKNRQKA
jgi:hypothetical protein